MPRSAAALRVGSRASATLMPSMYIARASEKPAAIRNTRSVANFSSGVS